MPRLHHQLVIERPAEGAVDDRGVPAQTWATLATVPGLAQPKRVDELAQLSQGGPVRGDWTIFTRSFLLNESDRVTVAEFGTFQVTGRRPAGGANHHLEVDAMLVTDAT